MDDLIDRKEFAIWGSNYTTAQWMIITISLSAIVIAVISFCIEPKFISKDIWRTIINCGIVFAVIWNMRLLTIRKIRIIIHAHQIQIFRNKKLYYQAPIMNLKYIIGVDIDSKEYNTATMILVFEDKRVVLSVPDSRQIMSKSSRNLLAFTIYMKDKYHLEKRDKEDVIFNDTCYYINNREKHLINTYDNEKNTNGA